MKGLPLLATLACFPGQNIARPRIPSAPLQSVDNFVEKHLHQKPTMPWRSWSIHAGAALQKGPSTVLLLLCVLLTLLIVDRSLAQCPKRDIKCTYPVLREFIASGEQLLGHASCIKKECPHVIAHDDGKSKEVILLLHNSLR